MLLNRTAACRPSLNGGLFCHAAYRAQFLYVDGVKNISSKSIQGLTIIKIARFTKPPIWPKRPRRYALQVNRAQGFASARRATPQVIRYDASSLPVGELVLDMAKPRILKDIYGLAATPHPPHVFNHTQASAPPPFWFKRQHHCFQHQPQ